MAETAKQEEGELGDRHVSTKAEKLLSEVRVAISRIGTERFGNIRRGTIDASAQLPNCTAGRSAFGSAVIMIAFKKIWRSHVASFIG